MQYWPLQSIEENSRQCLPPDLSVNPTFNVEDLTLYHRHDNDEDYEEQAITLPANSPPANKIINVLDDQIVSTHREVIQSSLFNGRTAFSTWITTLDLQRIQISMSITKALTHRS